jgi:hypothetical protein
MPVAVSCKPEVNANFDQKKEHTYTVRVRTFYCQAQDIHIKERWTIQSAAYVAKEILLKTFFSSCIGWLR